MLFMHNIYAFVFLNEISARYHCYYLKLKLSSKEISKVHFNFLLIGIKMNATNVHTRLNVDIRQIHVYAKWKLKRM